jgi:hypothetical protein
MEEGELELVASQVGRRPSCLKVQEENPKPKASQGGTGGTQQPGCVVTPKNVWPYTSHMTVRIQLN